MLKASLVESTGLDLSEEQLRVLVEQTFSEVCVDDDDRISFKEYDAMVRRNPSILESLTIRTVDFI